MNPPLSLETLRPQLKDYYKRSEAYLQHLEEEGEGYFQRYLRLVEQFASEAKRVLDAGCGTGLSSYLLSQKKEWVVGLDLSELFVRKGNQRYQARNLFLLAGDILELPFRDEAFDFVGCFKVIETLPDIRRGLDEMNRVLKRGGIFLVVNANLLSPIWPLKDFFRILFGGEPRPVWCETLGGALRTFRRNLWASLCKWFEREPKFLYHEPDLRLTGRKVVGRGSESPILICPLDVIRLLKARGFQILRRGARSGVLQRIFPSLAVGIEVVAKKR